MKEHPLSRLSIEHSACCLYRSLPVLHCLASLPPSLPDVEVGNLNHVTLLVSVGAEKPVHQCNSSAFHKSDNYELTASSEAKRSGFACLCV